MAGLDRLDRIEKRLRPECAQAAFLTSPCLMHVVQTRILRVVPLMLARTLWRFGSQRRRVLLWAWLMLLPLIGLFSQI
jgi:hypothetical protein